MHNRVGAGGTGEIVEAGGPRRKDKSSSAAEHALKGLRFISQTAVPGGWTSVETSFDKHAEDGLLHRSKFGKCIGMKGPRDLAFACELFDALARRLNIHRDSICKAELCEFWELISDTSFDSRLQTFFDMVDKDGDGRINEKEVKELWQLEMLLVHGPSDSMRNRSTTNSGNLSKVLSQRLSPTSESEPKPRPPRPWYSQARYFLEDNWRRCWVMFLWLSICVGLFCWKFVQYRRRAVFEVMGYCVCVAKGGAETLKFNMALVLLPVCCNTITWLRSRTAAGRFVPFDDSLRFHKVVAAGIVVGAGLHVVSHLTCDFPRLLHATDDEYEPMKPFFGDVKPPNYWWFVKGTEGWTGLAMLGLMFIAFTLATPCFRSGKLQLANPKHNRLTAFINTSLKRLTGFNAFWYTHHLFVAVYALLIVHGHFLYLTKTWKNKSTWMYLAVPIVLYACERLTRTLRSRVRLVEMLKVVVYPGRGNVLSLYFSKPLGFRYKSGQYIFVNCADVSPFQWHPFSITSAPQDDYVSVHIRTSGDWTEELKNIFQKVCMPPTDGKSTIVRAEYDHHNPLSILSFPKVRIDGPYGAPAQDYKQYDIVLLVGLGIGATPMISIIKDIINNIKRLGKDVESGSPVNVIPLELFRTRRAYFYWVTREQNTFEWFRGVMDEVADMDNEGVIELHNYCTNVYEEGDARSALIAMLQSLNYAKHGVDVVSGTHVKTHFARPNWPSVYDRIALDNPEQRIGVFYCGAPTLTKELRDLAKKLSRDRSTKFEFHSENF